MTNRLGIIYSNDKQKARFQKLYAEKAQDFFDEIIFINPERVTYELLQNKKIPIIKEGNIILNNLSMVYLPIYELVFSSSTNLLYLALQLDGCPVSDSFERFHRYGLGKGYEIVQNQASSASPDAYLLTSLAATMDLLPHLEEENKFPLIAKPSYSDQGREIEKVHSTEELSSYAKKYFSKKNSLLILEKFIHYKREWRIYLVEYDVVAYYEKDRDEHTLIANLAAGVPMKKVDYDMSNIFSFMYKSLSEEYKQGVYGIDIGENVDGELFLIEANRKPAWKNVLQLTGVHLPHEIAKRMFKRARIFH